MPLGREVALSPGDFVLDGDPASPPQKGAETQIFGPCLLWPNGCMYQDTTWYRGRLQPRRHCVVWEPSSPSPKGAQPPIFGQCPLWPNGWMAKMPLGMEVDLGPDDLCSMGTQLPPEKGTASPTQFLTHVYCGHGRPSQLLLSSCRQITMTTCWYSYNGHNDTVAEMLHGHCSYSLGGITVIENRVGCVIDKARST